MPSRSRRDSETPSADRPDATVTPINRNIQEAPHTEKTSKTVKGKVASKPEQKIANGQLITTFRITEEGRNGKPPTVWSAEVWKEDKADKANEELRVGDEIAAISQWKPDREHKGNAYTHQLSVIDIGVTVGDKMVSIDQFDRSMLTALQTPPLETQGLAEASGMDL